MNFGFCIELRPEVSHECGGLFVGEVVTTFEVTLDRWHRADYAESWQRELRALIAGERAVALMTDVPEERDGVARGFVCELLQDGAVAVSRREFHASALADDAGVPRAPLASRNVGSVGVTTLAAVAAFLERTR